MSQPLDEPTRARPSWSARWVLLGLGVVAVVVVLVLLPWGPPAKVVRLARIEPLPVEAMKPTEPGSFEARRDSGLKLYQQRRYTEARASLLRAEELQTDDTVSLYLASTEMLLGMDEEAMGRLRRLSRDAGEASVRDEALWQLANLALSMGEVAESEHTLHQLVEMHDLHGPDAAELLDAIDAARK